MRSKGSVLILTLFVLSVLSLTALSLTYRSGLETRSARHQAIQIKLKALSRSAAAVALSELQRNTNAYDHPAEPWRTHAPLASRQFLPELSLMDAGFGGEPTYVTTYSVIDEEGKLHVLNASSEALEDLGLDRPQVDAIFDWMDEDAIPRAEGAEDAYYLARPLPHRTKNGPIEMIEELLMVRGVTNDVFFGEDINQNRRLDVNEDDGMENMPADNADGVMQLGLVDVLTTLGNGRINLNTAPRVVLETLPISDQAVDQIIGYRTFDDFSHGSIEDHVFQSVEDIEQLQGLTDADRDVLTQIAGFSSQYYRVRVESKHMSTGLHHRFEVVVQISDRGLGIIQWQ